MSLKESLRVSYQISAYPTLILFSKGNKQGVLYKGKRNAESYLKWLQPKIGLEPSPAEIKEDDEKLALQTPITSPVQSNLNGAKEQVQELKAFVEKMKEGLKKSAEEKEAFEEHKEIPIPEIKEKELPPPDPLVHEVSSN